MFSSLLDSPSKPIFNLKPKVISNLHINKISKNKNASKIMKTISHQDRGIGRHLPPRTTKKRTTKNLNTKNNQNCQKIKLYGSQSIKELKKHSFRQIGGVETDNQ